MEQIVLHYKIHVHAKYIIHSEIIMGLNMDKVSVAKLVILKCCISMGQKVLI